MEESPGQRTSGAGAQGATGAERRRGLLAAGDRVQLTDAKGRMHTITLAPGKQFHTHRGIFDHDTLGSGSYDQSIITLART